MEGNRNDIKFADKLIKNLNYTTVLEDRGYDANWFREIIHNPVILGRKSRKIPIEYNKDLYKTQCSRKIFLKNKSF